MTKKQILSKIGFYIVLAITFCICAVIVVAFAIGYKVDLKTREISQTGIIIVRTDNTKNEIYIDDIKEGEGRVLLRNVDPRSYSAKISRKKYQDYNYEFYLNPGEAKIIDNIVLFYTNPTVKQFTDKVEVPFSSLADTGRIAVSGNELFINGEYLTRFENKISDACWYPNERFVGVTVDNVFKIIDIETLNVFDLFEKRSDQPVIFLNSGQTALFQSDSKLFTAEIR